MNKLRTGTQYMTEHLKKAGEHLKKIFNNTVVPPPAYRPGMLYIRHTDSGQTTNRNHVLFVDQGRIPVLLSRI